MAFSKHLIKMNEASLHPPSLVSPEADDAEIPWVLLDHKAYVADRCNDTTAVSYSRCGKQIQVSFFAARPPRVSYLCVFSRCPADARKGDEEEIIPIEPQVIATDDNLVLLRIIVCPEETLFDGADLYIYRPAGDGGPLLRRLERPPDDYFFNSYQVCILSCPTDRLDGSSNLSFLSPNRAPEDKQYMVVALCDCESRFEGGRFVLYLYNPKIRTWTTSAVTVEDQHFQKYQQEGYFFHDTCKVISIGGEYGTIGFVDLWRGILLCDVFNVQTKPVLRYVPVPQPLQPGEPFMYDARLSRDIAVIKGNFKYIQQKLHWESCPASIDQYIRNGSMSAIWTRPVDACSLDDTWRTDCDMESFRMDVKSNPDFQLLQKFQDNEGKPFKRLIICQPTLNLHSDDHTVCFMVKINHYDHKAWVIAVDMKNNNLQGVAEFAAGRYTAVGFAYLHSRISKYLKRANHP